MWTLIIETSSEKGCLILAENGLPIEVMALGGGPQLSKNLGMRCKEIISKCKAALHDREASNAAVSVGGNDASSQGPYRTALQLVAVGTGPGSFTGIRVGVALAKALSYGWRVPLLGFCSLRAFGPAPVLVDAKGGGFYALLDENKPPLLLPPSDPRLPSLFRSPHPEIIQKRLSRPGQGQETEPDPGLLAALVYRQFLEEGAAPLAMNYLSSP